MPKATVPGFNIGDASGNESVFNKRGAEIQSIKFGVDERSGGYGRTAWFCYPAADIVEMRCKFLGQSQAGD
jgi:hypothetical protein